jgi:hypothetical protein
LEGVEVVRFESLPAWQQHRAATIAEACRMVSQMVTNGTPKLEALRTVADAYNGKELIDGKHKLKVSAATLRRFYDREWRHGRKEPRNYVQHYTAARAQEVPKDLITEWRRRLTIKGQQYGAHAYKQIQNEWAAGQSIPGLGTWIEHWQSTHPGHEIPNKPPAFPFSYSTMQRYRPSKLVMAMANQGIAAARQMITKIQRDYSTLRPCELYALDDVKLDVAVIDDVSGTYKAVEPVMYVMMEGCSRYIAGFVTRGAESIVAQDVDALVAHVLGTLGVGNGYPTHIIFERGTVACSEARQQFLEGLFPERLFIHRTGMNSGKTSVGAFKDAATGKPYSKGMIEAFMRKLHIRLSHLPGQTGNKYARRPASLGNQIEAAESLAYMRAATGLQLESAALLTLSQLNTVVREAIKDYNHDRDHGMSGFHSILQVETAPNVWKDTNQIIEPDGSEGGLQWGPTPKD